MQTLSDFVGDFAERLAKLLTSYVDATIATSSMNAQSSEFSRKAIRQIVPSVEGVSNNVYTTQHGLIFFDQPNSTVPLIRERLLRFLKYYMRTSTSDPVTPSSSESP